MEPGRVGLPTQAGSIQDLLEIGFVSGQVSGGIIVYGLLLPCLHPVIPGLLLWPLDHGSVPRPAGPCLLVLVIAAEVCLVIGLPSRGLQTGSAQLVHRL